MQDSSHIKSHAMHPIAHLWTTISRTVITHCLSTSLLFLIVNAQGEPLEARDTSQDHQDASDTAKPSSLGASTSKVAQDLVAPRSVVKFEVPIRRIEDGARRNFIENCSAYAVKKTSERYLFLSSWHCIDGYQRTRKSPILKHAGRTTQPILGESGGDMTQDWLLLTAPQVAFDRSLTLTPLASKPVKAGEILYGFGWGGYAQSSRSTPKVLTCRAMEVGRRLTLDCGFSKGDSGGLIARRINSGYEAVGIISAGDSSTITYAYPISALPTKVSSQLLTIID
ncbi:MAG: hypothetical protein VW779_03490 [Halieaceae bacterium]